METQIYNKIIRREQEEDSESLKKTKITMRAYVNLSYKANPVPMVIQDMNIALEEFLLLDYFTIFKHY